MVLLVLFSKPQCKKVKKRQLTIRQRTKAAHVYYFKPGQIDPHGVMHGDGMSTRYPLTMNEINKKGLTSKQWMDMLDAHYNNPDIQHIRGDLRIVDKPGKPGKMLAENVSPAEAWKKAKEWAATKGHLH